MRTPKFAKLFKNGKSQAARLPQEFRFAGDRVRVRRVGNGVLLEPDKPDLVEWFAKLHVDCGGFDIERDQPTTPDTGVFFD